MPWSRVRDKSRHSGRRAFSYIELVLVVAIVAVVSGMAVPRYATSKDRYRLDAVTARVIADLAYARSIARAETRRVIVDFDPGNNEYTIVEVPDPRDPGEDYAVCLEDSPYSASLVSVSIDTKEKFGFNAAGLPVTHDKGRPFSNDGQIIVAVGDQQRAITLDLTTGRGYAP